MRSLKIFFFFLLILACSAPPSEAQTVYITKTGAKYHVGSCQYLRKSKIAIAMKDAVDRGYEPCSVCEPGTLASKKTPATSGVTESKPTVVPEKSNLSQGSSQKSVQCSGTTKAGTRCKRMTTSPNGRCYQH